MTSVDECWERVEECTPCNPEEWITVRATILALVLAELDEVKEAVVGHFAWDDADGAEDLADLLALFGALRARLVALGQPAEAKGEDG